MPSGFERSAGWESKDPIPILFIPSASKLPNFKMSLVVPVEICFFRSCTLYKHGARKRSQEDQNCHRIVSILDQHGQTEEGRKVWLQNRRGKRARIERGASLTEGGTHSEPMHSNIYTVKPIYWLFVHPLNLSSSLLSPYRYKLTKAVMREVGWRRQ